MPCTSTPTRRARLLVVLSFVTLGSACGGEVKLVDCNTPDKCTGAVPVPTSINARVCALGISEPVCGAIYQRLLQCVFDRKPCPQLADAGNPAFVYCSDVMHELAECRIAQSKRTGDAAP